LIVGKISKVPNLNEFLGKKLFKNQQSGTSVINLEFIIAILNAIFWQHSKYFQINTK
jgi:hypothetical protein